MIKQIATLALVSTVGAGCTPWFGKEKPAEKLLVPKLVTQKIPPAPKECRPNAKPFPTLADKNRGTVSLQRVVTKWRGARQQYNNVIAEKRICSVYVRGLQNRPPRPSTNPHQDKTS